MANVLDQIDNLQDYVHNGTLIIDRDFPGVEVDSLDDDTILDDIMIDGDIDTDMPVSVVDGVRLIVNGNFSTGGVDVYSLDVSGNIEVNGELHAGHVNAGGDISADNINQGDHNAEYGRLFASGKIYAKNDIESFKEIASMKDIEAGGSIKSRGTIQSVGGIVAGGDIETEKADNSSWYTYQVPSIESYGNIIAGGSIHADEGIINGHSGVDGNGNADLSPAYIRAGGDIEAKGYIISSGEIEAGGGISCSEDDGLISGVIDNAFSADGLIIDKDFPGIERCVSDDGNTYYHTNGKDIFSPVDLNIKLDEPLIIGFSDKDRGELFSSGNITSNVTIRTGVINVAPWRDTCFNHEEKNPYLLSDGDIEASGCVSAHGDVFCKNITCGEDVTVWGSIETKGDADVSGYIDAGSIYVEDGAIKAYGVFSEKDIIVEGKSGDDKASISASVVCTTGTIKTDGDFTNDSDRTVADRIITGNKEWQRDSFRRGNSEYVWVRREELGSDSPDDDYEFYDFGSIEDFISEEAAESCVNGNTIVIDKDFPLVEWDQENGRYMISEMYCIDDTRDISIEFDEPFYMSGGIETTGDITSRGDIHTGFLRAQNIESKNGSITAFDEITATGTIKAAGDIKTLSDNPYGGIIVDGYGDILAGGEIWSESNIWIYGDGVIEIGSIEAGSSIFSNKGCVCADHIRAKGSIEAAGGFINSRGDIESGANVSAGYYVGAVRNITAAGNIIADKVCPYEYGDMENNSLISAEGDIKAGGFIKTAKEIYCEGTVDANEGIEEHVDFNDIDMEDIFDTESEAFDDDVSAEKEVVEVDNNEFSQDTNDLSSDEDDTDTKEYVNEEDMDADDEQNTDTESALDDSSKEMTDMDNEEDAFNQKEEMYDDIDDGDALLDADNSDDDEINMDGIFNSGSDRDNDNDAGERSLSADDNKDRTDKEPDDDTRDGIDEDRDSSDQDEEDDMEDERSDWGRDW